MGHNDLERVEYIHPPTKEYYANKPIDLWWPFWAWRIIAPTDSNDTDLFQELILRLIKAGCHNRAKLAELTCLTEEFVSYLLAVLSGKGWISDWKLSSLGEDVLLEGYESGRDVRSGYILQDPKTNKLVPRVFDKLNYVNGVAIDRISASYIASRASGKKIRPFLLRPKAGLPELPSVDAVYKAIRDHRLDKNRLKQAGFESTAVPLHEDQVECLDETAFPVYMHLQLFSEMGGERSWYISDPGSLLPSVEDMNRIADHWLDTDKHFAGKVEELLGISSRNTVSLDEANRQRDDKAKAHIIKEYPWVTQFPMVESNVIAMLSDRDMIDGKHDARQWMIEHFVASQQKVCEAVIKVLSPPGDQVDDWQKVKFPNERNSRHQIKAIYLSCDAVDEELAWNFSGVRSGQIRSAMTEGNQSLRQLLAAMVLRLPAIVTEIDRAIPKWLNRTIDLANTRNKADHANNYVIEMEEAFRHYHFVETFLKLIEGSVTNG